MGFGLIAVFACDSPKAGTPGLEPPVLGTDASRGLSASAPLGFGNADSEMQMRQSPTGTAGAAAVPSTAPPTGLPVMAPLAGAGAAGMQAMMPPGADPASPSMPDAGTGAPDDGLSDHDFLPECEDETALALTADGVCSFPLTMAGEVTPELAQIALVSNGQFSLVEHVDGPLGCDLLNGGFFFDRAESPTRITLCTQSCLRAGAATEMQVVLVLGCAPTAP